MKTRLSLVAWLLSLASIAQTPWVLPGNPTVNPNIDYLGTQNNVELVLRTDALLRFRLNRTLTYGTLGSFSNIPAHGFALITPNDLFLQSGPKGPFSRLHLAEGVEGNTQTISYRPWQRNGITFTGNKDHGYVGQKYGEEEDNTDMVIDWSDNPGAGRPDRLRFLFTSGYDPMAATGAQSYEGLEGMRLWPKSYEEVNVGVGDFFADGTEPTERLHVVNGRVRIEELPNNFEAEGLTKVVVVDDAATDERGVLKWMDITNLIPVDCEWSMPAASPNNVSTAFGGSSATCPDNAEAVGIGVDLGSVAPTGKLVVSSSTFANGVDVSATASVFDNRGVNVLATGTSGVSGYNQGVYATLNGIATRTAAVVGQSNGATFYGWGGIFHSMDNSPYTTGVEGIADLGSTEGIGVFGLADGNGVMNKGVKGQAVADLTTGSRYYGVSGYAEHIDNSQFALGVHGEAPVAANSWAGWFEGDVMVNGTAYYPGPVRSPRMRA